MSKNVLLTNDDGISALGINLLEKHLVGLGLNVFVIAPHIERSCCGHGLSLGKEVFVREIHPNKYSCEGLPADCVHLGVHKLFSHINIDYVLSGINHGGNLGQDIYYSGTVAGAREGSFLNIPSVALSLYEGSPSEDSFNHIKNIVNLSLLNEVTQKFKRGTVVNINAPDSRLFKHASRFDTKLEFRHYANSIIKGQNGGYIIDGKLSHSQEIDDFSDSKIVENGNISISFIKVF